MNFLLTKKIWLTPSPSTMAEIQYLYTNLRRIGPIESFRIKPHDLGYDNQLWVTYNLSSRYSLNPFEKIEEQEDDEQQLKALKARTNDYLRKIIAIPKYQFVHNDQQYLNGNSRIKLNHRLINQGLKYHSRFEITDSTISSPFCLINLTNPIPGENVDNGLGIIKRDIRFNFERFTKLII